MKAALFFAHMDELARNLGADRGVGAYTPRCLGVAPWNYYGVRLVFGDLDIGVLVRCRRGLTARAAADVVATACLTAWPKIYRAVRRHA